MATPVLGTLKTFLMLWPALLTTIGPTTYTLLSNLFAPKDKSLAEITAALTKHFEPM